MRIVLALCIVSLMGCAHKGNTILTDASVSIPPSMLQPCAPLAKLPEKATIRDVLDVSVSNAEVYLDCKNKQDNSIKLIKELGGL